MNEKLPFLPVDEEFSLNLSIVLIVIMVLGKNSKDRYVLDFDKIQIFFYLIKNPSKISPVLGMLNAKHVFIDSQFTHTIESMSSNVDSLFIKDKLKNLIKYTAFLGYLGCHRKEADNSFYYYLNDNGASFVNSLISSDKEQIGYLYPAYQLASHLKPLQSQTNSKLNMILNSIFKGN